MNIWRALVIATCLWCAGCGCGDTPNGRQVRIYQFTADAQQDFEVQVQPDLVAGQKTIKEGLCGKPVTEIRLATNRPVKIIIVPATQP